MLGVMVLPNGWVRAADDCWEAQNAKPPQGSHWYYRIDGAKRHCWYLGPEGQKVHRAEPEVQPAPKSEPPLQTGGERSMASAQVEQRLPPPRPATAAGTTAQASAPAVAPGARLEPHPIMQ